MQHKHGKTFYPLQQAQGITQVRAQLLLNKAEGKAAGRQWGVHPIVMVMLWVYPLCDCAMNKDLHALEKSDFCATGDAAGAQAFINPNRPEVLAHRPDKSHNKANLLTRPILPDPAICRAQSAGFANYVECLVHRPIQCQHALSFGYKYFCRHPEGDVIVMRTSAQV